MFKNWQNPLHRNTAAHLRLRLSLHSLGIVVRRHFTPPKLPEDNDINYSFIFSGQLDDAIHFVMHCKAYDNLKTVLLDLTLLSAGQTKDFKNGSGCCLLDT